MSINKNRTAGIAGSLAFMGKHQNNSAMMLGLILMAIENDPEPVAMECPGKNHVK